MSTYRRSMSAAAVVALICAGLPAVATPDASAATLVGGRAQAAIRAAFEAQPAHRGEAIVSIRASTAAPAWAVVRSVTPQRAGDANAPSSVPRLHSDYYESAGGGEHEGSPPAAARRDLDRPFSVAIVYQGSGQESISYARQYTSGCAGQGDMSDQEIDTVSPMAWDLRFVVSLDDLLSAVSDSGQTVLVPQVSFDTADSSVDAVETVTRTMVDSGCGGSPSTSTCRIGFRAGGADPDGLLSFAAGGAPQIGVPLAQSSAGDCDSAAYPIGPSLWDGGAAAALADRLGLLGGRLPSDPYAPVPVSWPASASPDLAASPCQGDGAACTDHLRWSGTVTLRPATSG
ncbi:MAG: hypothetical protein ACRDMJ_08310 [Solirubrobacteraceae bacterium]